MTMNRPILVFLGGETYVNYTCFELSVGPITNVFHSIYIFHGKLTVKKEIHREGHRLMVTSWTLP